MSIASRYDEPHRRYHGRAHLDHVLAEVERLLLIVPGVDDADAVRLAALFHDAVYDPTSSTNEADSAALARRTLTGHEPSERIAAVERLVLATAGHIAASPDEAVLLDADLSVLGADPAAYDRYAAGVRAEYAHVSDDDWRTGRAAILERFLARDRIFATVAMGDAEARARANLTREIRGLRTGSPPGSS